MSALHVVYRCGDDQPELWQGYAVADDAAVAADTLPRARQQMSQVLTRRIEAWPWQGLVEHTEHRLHRRLWVREALDERVAERGHTTRVLLEALGDHRLRERLAGLPETTAGGVVVLAGVPGDRLDWIRDQHDEHGSLVVATAVSNHRLWWNTLVPAPRAQSTTLPTAGSLADLDLADLAATLDDWLAASDCGHQLTLPTATPTPARSLGLRPAAAA